jgi:hypothetical protein
MVGIALASRLTSVRLGLGTASRFCGVQNIAPAFNPNAKAPQGAFSSETLLNSVRTYFAKKP